MAANVVPLVKYSGQAGWDDVGSFGGTNGFAQVRFDSQVEDVVLPLVNDSVSADGQPFAYRVQLISGPVTKRPRTKITRQPPKRTKKRTATFAFAASERSHFQCKLDRHRFKPCKSPLKVRVKPGAHVLEVRAIDLAGSVGRPARWSWKVVRNRR